MPTYEFKLRVERALVSLETRVEASTIEASRHARALSRHNGGEPIYVFAGEILVASVAAMSDDG